jgi:hypothetical protein
MVRRECATLPDGTQLDLNQATDLVNCGHPSCSSAEMSVRTADRPWGPNNPIWRLYAHGPLATFGSHGAIDSRVYVVVWVSDDPLENDGGQRSMAMRQADRIPGAVSCKSVRTRTALPARCVRSRPPPALQRRAFA